MPQPLLRVRRIGSYSFGLGAIYRQKELCAHIGQIVAAWGSIESTLGEVLSELLHADMGVGVTMYLSIKSPSARREAIEAAAHAALTGESLLVFLAVQSLV